LLPFQVRVSIVSVLELAQDFTVLSQETVTQDFTDGEPFNYTSYLARNGLGFDVADDQIPKVIQINIFGFNAENQPVINFFAIAFGNECGTSPVFEEGNTAGWLTFVSTKNTIRFLNTTFSHNLLTNILLSE
jgi:hypothetical protein